MNNKIYNHKTVVCLYNYFGVLQILEIVSYKDISEVFDVIICYDGVGI